MISRILLPVIILTQLFSYFFYVKFEDYNFLTIYFMVGGVSVFFIKRNQNIYFLLFFIFIFFLFLLFGFLSSNNSFLLNAYNLFLGIFAFLSAYILFQINNAYKYIRLIFILYTAMLLYYLIKFGFSEPDLYNTIFVKGSRNYVSGVYIFILCLLILTYNSQGLKIPFIYPLLTFLGCIVLYGRSGIIISGVILICLYLFDKKYLFLKMILLSSIFLLLIYNLDLIMNFFSEKTSFSYGVRSDRTIMLEQYISGLSEQDFSILFGANIQECCRLIEFFDNNPHNSFIAGHMRFGILHTIFIVSILLYTLSSRNLLYIFILLVLYARLFLDQLGVFSPLDIVIFYLLFLTIKYKKKRKCNA